MASAVAPEGLWEAEVGLRAEQPRLEAALLLAVEAARLAVIEHGHGGAEWLGKVDHGLHLRIAPD